MRDREESLSQEEAKLLRGVDQELAVGQALHDWWRERGESTLQRNGFELITPARGFDGAYGFRERVTLTGGGSLPVMGFVQRLHFTRPKALPGLEKEAGKWICRQLRQFALRYFMRVSNQADPQAYPELGHLPLPSYLQLFSWCPAKEIERSGIGFEQVYYKHRDGRLGRFSKRQREAVVDLRRLREDLQWIVVKSTPFDVSVTLSLFGAGKLVVPLKRRAHIVLSGELISDETQPRPGCLGVFGPGWILLSAQDAGLDKLRPSFETFQFEVSETGVCQAKQVFVCRQPEKRLSLSLDAHRWGGKVSHLMPHEVQKELAPLLESLEPRPKRSTEVDPLTLYSDLAHLLLGAQAHRHSPITRQQMDRDFLAQHSLHQYRVVLGTLQTWNEVPDWLDGESLPPWIPRSAHEEGSR